MLRTNWSAGTVRACFVGLSVWGGATLGGCSSGDGPARSGSPATSKDAGADSTASDGGSAAHPCRGIPALGKRRDACEFGPGDAPSDTIGACTGDAIPIEHVVVIMQENRSFDHYFGHLPGHGQDDVDVPQDVPMARAPADAGAPIPWHHEAAYCVLDTDHGWIASHTEWNGGKNDGFAVANATAKDPTGQRAMGYYDHTDIPFYYDLVSTFATSDRYFCSLLGPTYANRIFFYAGTSFGVATTQIDKLAPKGAPQVLKSLNEKNVSWKVYKTDLASSLVFLDFTTDAAQASHFGTVDDFHVDAAAGTLPAVSFVDSGFSHAPTTETDEHPPADMQLGQHWVWQQVQALTQSPVWSSSALFITYDEHGGLYDHVSPPAACPPDETPPAVAPELGGFDRLGFRVPLIVVSPYAKRHFVSHEVHSHTSILRFIEAKFGLAALTRRDANSDAMLDLFDFESPPNLDVPAFAEPDVDPVQLDACKAFP